MTQVETLGPSEHETNLYSQWKHPTREIHFCVHPGRSLANLGLNRDARLQRGLVAAPVYFTFLHFFLFFPFLGLFVNKSGLASPVLAPRQNPTGRFSSPRLPLWAAQRRGVLRGSELSLGSISHRRWQLFTSQGKAKRRQREDVAVSQKAGFVPHYMGCGRTPVPVHPVPTS